MKLSELIKRLDLKLLTKSDFEDREITGGYCGDLLSWVMGKAKPGNVWITIMSNVNIVAVASLTDAACILLSENMNLEREIIEKADEQDVVILRSSKPSYILAAEVFQADEK